MEFPAQLLRIFLLVAPLNYFYVMFFDWQVTWSAAGGVSEGAPTVIKYAKDVIFLIILYIWYRTLLLGEKQPQIKRHALDLLVLVFIFDQVVMALPAMASLGILPSLIALWQNCGYALVYFMMRSILDSASKPRLMGWIVNFYLMGGAIALIGVVQYLFFPNTASYYTSGNYAGLRRAISTLGTPNNLGMYLGFLLSAAVYLNLVKKNVLFFVVAVIMLSCLILTVSMTSLFSTIIVCGLIFVLRKQYFLLIGMLSAGCVIATGVLSPLLYARVSTALSGKDESWLLRLENWKALWPGDILTMLFGGGGGTGGAMTVAFHDVSGDLADNQYLATVIQFGLFGLLLYIGLLFTGARAFSSGPGKDDHNRPPIRLSGGIIVILAGLFGISGNILNVFPINLYFFSALALVATAQANGNS